MTKKFKYDYNNKLFFINLSLSMLFLFISIIAFEKNWIYFVFNNNFFIAV